MPNVQIPPGLSESGDVDHDQTQGGTEGNPHGDSAANADVSSIQSSSDVDHDNTSGGTAGNPHSGSASDNHGNAAHSSTFAVDGNAQPPENHGNAAHNTNFAADGDPQPPENHGNASHNANYITDAGVTSVNGQSGSVSVDEIPSGVITMWSGSTSDVPSGWTLCDGSNGAPDLRDKFVVGAGNQYSSGNTGGQDNVQLSENEMPSHDHTGSTTTDGSHKHDLETNGTQSPNELYVGTTSGTHGGRSVLMDSAGSHNHSLNISNAGGDNSHENRPPYYALAYIYKL